VGSDRQDVVVNYEIYVSPVGIRLCANGLDQFFCWDGGPHDGVVPLEECIHQRKEPTTQGGSGGRL
jgi:hypothetical protein